MNAAKLDLKNGSVFINSELVRLDEKGALVRPILKLCSPPTKKDEGKIQYRLLDKVSVFGKSADCVIEVKDETIYATVFLFDFIEFFESSILESKIIKLCEKSSGQKFLSDHPSTAFLKDCKWGQVIFFYDAKQGDLSLNIIYRLKED